MEGHSKAHKNISANHLSDGGLVPRIHKELSKLNSKQTNNPVKNQANDLNREVTKGDIMKGKQAREKLLTTVSNQENADQPQ